MQRINNKSPMRKFLIALAIILGVALSVIFSVILLLAVVGFVLMLLLAIYIRQRWLRWRRSGPGPYPGVMARSGHTIEGEYTIERENDGHGTGGKH